MDIVYWLLLSFGNILSVLGPFLFPLSLTCLLFITQSHHGFVLLKGNIIFIQLDFDYEVKGSLFPPNESYDPVQLVRLWTVDHLHKLKYICLIALILQSI